MATKKRVVYSLRGTMEHNGVENLAVWRNLPFHQMFTEQAKTPECGITGVSLV